MALRRFLLAALALSFTAGCRDCADLGAVKADGLIVPPVFEFGPLAPGQKCTATLQVQNHGQEDLTVSAATLENTKGAYALQKAPTSVPLGSEGDLTITYTVGSGADGTVESTGVKLTTDDPKNGGILRGSVSAIISSNPSASAKTQCGTDNHSPCNTVDFGATQTNGAGVQLSVVVVNDGTADMHISAALLDGAATDPNVEFSVASVQLGNTLVTDFPANAITVPPGRSSDCGKATGTDVNKVTFNLLFVPTVLGAAADTLDIVTDGVAADGAAGGLIHVALSGVGSDTGIVLSPNTVNFGALGEGQTQTVDVLVENVGTSTASVNDTCISLNDDGNCDAVCTGQPEDAALQGTLTCKVTKSDGTTLESHGYVLAATDAVAGGDDERHVLVTWAPIAGATSIPGTAVLTLKSTLLGGCTTPDQSGCFNAQILGGTIGIITPSSADGSCAGGPSADACVHATGTPGDANFLTWQGTVTLTLTNTGQATVHLGTITKDGNSGITNDYSIGAPSITAIAPGDHADIVVTYDESTGGDAAASDEIMNVVVNHDGSGGKTTIVVDVIPPT